MTEETFLALFLSFTLCNRLTIAKNTFGFNYVSPLKGQAAMSYGFHK